MSTTASRTAGRRRPARALNCVGAVALLVGAVLGWSSSAFAAAPNTVTATVLTGSGTDWSVGATLGNGEAQAAPPPAAPSNLSVTQSCSGGQPIAEFVWTATPTAWADGYTLTRLNDSSTQTVAGRTTTAASDGPLTAGTSYTWNLRAGAANWASSVIAGSLTPSSCTPTLVQVGPAGIGSGTSLTATFSAASTSGDLLVATLFTGQKCVTFTPPAGWLQAVAISDGGCKHTAAIFYYPGAPATTSATFTLSQTTSVYGRLSEYSHVDTGSPLDQTGSAAILAAGSATPSVSTAGATTAASELAVTVWEPLLSTSSIGPGTGWTAAFDDAGNGAASHFQTGIPTGSIVSETAVSGTKVTWLAAVATFRTP